MVAKVCGRNEVDMSACQANIVPATGWIYSPLTMRILRVLRGIVTTALTWGVVWAPFGLVSYGMAAAFGIDWPIGILAGLVVGKAVTGAISGGVFGALLAVAGRRRTFDSLSLPWIAGLGAIGGALFPVATRVIMLTMTDIAIPVSVLLVGLATSALLGAGCAAATLAIARRAPALPSSDRSSAPAVSAGAA